MSVCHSVRASGNKHLFQGARSCALVYPETSKEGRLSPFQITVLVGSGQGDREVILLQSPFKAVYQKGGGDCERRGPEA